MPELIDIKKPHPIDTNWFRNKIRDAHLSQRKLAARLDRDPSAVSLMLNGLRKMTMEEASLLADALSTPIDEIMSRAGIDTPRPPNNTAVVGWADEQGLVTIGKADGPRLTPTPPGLSESAQALRLPGGWTIYYTPGNIVDPEASGRFAVVQLSEGGPRYVRVLNRGYESGKWTLTPFAPSMGESVRVENVRIEWAVPVTWIKM